MYAVITVDLRTHYAETHHMRAATRDELSAAFVREVNAEMGTNFADFDEFAEWAQLEETNPVYAIIKIA